MEFNESVAQRVYEHIAAMDDDEAVTFAKFFVADIYADDLANNARTVARHNATTTEEVAKMLHERLVDGDDPEELVAIAAAYAISRELIPFAKADSNRGNYRQNTPWKKGEAYKWQTRNKGRFGPLSNQQWKSRIENQAKKVKASQSNRDSFERRRASAAESYNASTQAEPPRTNMRAWDKWNRDNTKLKDESERATRRYEGANADFESDTARYQRTTERYNKIRGDEINRVGSNAAWASGAAETFADDVTYPIRPESGFTGTMDRISATGRLATQVGQATGNDKLAIAGLVAEHAGKFGPEAEKVIGPSLRRLAYRYRGTERTPDPEIDRLRKQAAVDVMGRAGMSNQATARTANGTVVRRQVSSPWQALDAEQKVAASERAAVQYLSGGYTLNDKEGRGKSRIASRRYAELQRKSGRVTPSEGILIDDNGKIVAQAVGYAEDHYLPFNLKNMTELQGGSYVRTRETGGLTTEDIYTGLISGARSVNVVSNSGTFTIDFADDLRGARRNSDKARQMVDQYGKLLDAVKSKQVSHPDRRLTMQDRAKITAQVEDRLAEDGRFFPPDVKAEMVQREIAAEMARPRLSSREVSEMEEKIGRIRNDDAINPRDKREAVAIIEADYAARMQERTYKLDGEGYGAAMESMQEQFPYFIDRVKYTPRRLEGPDGSVDQGYVKPRHLHPANALAGYFDPSIEGDGIEINGQRTGKRRGDNTQYQNWSVRGARRQGGSEGGGERREGGESTGDKPKDAPSASGATASTYASGAAQRVNSAERDNALQADLDGFAAAFEATMAEGPDKYRGLSGIESPSFATLDTYLYKTENGQKVVTSAQERSEMLGDPEMKRKLASAVVTFGDAYRQKQPGSADALPRNLRTWSDRNERPDFDGGEALKKSPSVPFALDRDTLIRAGTSDSIKDINRQAAADTEEQGKTYEQWFKERIANAHAEHDAFKAKSTGDTTRTRGYEQQIIDLEMARSLNHDNPTRAERGRRMDRLRADMDDPSDPARQNMDRTMSYMEAQFGGQSRSSGVDVQINEPDTIIERAVRTMPENLANDVWRVTEEADEMDPSDYGSPQAWYAQMKDFGDALRDFGMRDKPVDDWVAAMARRYSQ